MTLLPLAKLRLQLRFECFRINTRPDAPDDVEPIAVRGLEARGLALEHRLLRQGHPEIRNPRAQVGPEEPWSRNSYHRKWLAVNLKCRSNHRRVFAVFRDPGVIAHHRNRRS